MELYAELWNPKPAWSALSQQERAAFVDAIGPGMQSLIAQGVELLGFARNDADTPLRSPHAYLALWRMNDHALVELLEATVEECGWHTYFDQVNARGEALSPQDAFAQMIAE